MGSESDPKEKGVIRVESESSRWPSEIEKWPQQTTKMIPWTEPDPTGLTEIHSILKLNITPMDPS